MKWEIEEDLLENDVIIEPEFVDENYICWDFALDGRFELCALFPRNRGETLEDYKKAGLRPVLYHKNLRMYHVIPKEYTFASYILYPATIRDNVLRIGNQTQGNVVYYKDIKSNINFKLVHERKRKWFFFWRKRYDVEKITLKMDKSMDELYYKISGNIHVFSINIFEGEITIFLKEKETVDFYLDQECMKRVETETCEP